MHADAREVLAFRLAGQHLAEPAADAGEVLRGWGVQDSPPGTAAAAVLARVQTLEPGALDAALQEERSLVALYGDARPLRSSRLDGHSRIVEPIVTVRSSGSRK
jgi:hypothetical protein